MRHRRRQISSSTTTVFAVAALSALLLCGAGTSPLLNNILQSDLNANGHNILNAASISAESVSIGGVTFTNLAPFNTPGGLLLANTNGIVPVNIQIETNTASAITSTNLPTGVLALATDTGVLYVGTPSGNASVASASASWSFKTNAYTAVSGDKLALNSTTAAFSIAMPSATGTGAEIDALDATGQCATHNVTFTGTINGTTNLILNTAGGTARFVDVGGSIGWRAN